MLAALKLGVHLAWRAGRISDHDALVGRTLATVLAGGALPHQTTVSEQYLLDLEREAFLKLCGERKTLERIQHTLKTGKTAEELRLHRCEIVDRGRRRRRSCSFPASRAAGNTSRPRVDALAAIVPRADVLARRRAGSSGSARSRARARRRRGARRARAGPRGGSTRGDLRRLVRRRRRAAVRGRASRTASRRWSWRRRRGPDWRLTAAHRAVRARAAGCSARCSSLETPLRLRRGDRRGASRRAPSAGASCCGSCGRARRGAPSRSRAWPTARTLLDATDRRRRLRDASPRRRSSSPASAGSTTSSRSTAPTTTCALIRGARHGDARAHGPPRLDHAPGRVRVARARLHRARDVAPAPARERSSRTAERMLREIAGPAGRLEAPARRAARRRAPRAAVVFAHPHPQYGGTMHTKVVYQAAKALSADRLRGAALQLPRRRRERRHVQRRPGRDGRLPRGARLHARAAIRRRRSGRPACRSASWIALTIGAADPRVSALIGIAPPLDRVRLRRRSRRARSRSSSSRANATRSARSRTCARSTRAPPSRRSWSSSTTPTICSTARSARSPTRSRICWRETGMRRSATSRVQLQRT